jgi:beta-lactamase superfamily II metal-dependent hydrolase
MRRSSWIVALVLLIVIVAVLARRNRAATPPASTTGTTQPTGPASDLVVRVLDVGLGDATLVTNGRSIALIDGGPDGRQLGAQLDRLGIGHDTTIDVVVLSHAHSDHYMGLRELFSSRRRLRVRYFFENRDVSPNRTLGDLRDSVIARARRGELTYRDADDPCGDGRPVCVVTMNGGARLDVLRPPPSGDDVNDRSVAVKVVAPDSGFTMWLAGDAEHAELAWFDSVGYDDQPGMDVDVLKADHHGSCNGVSAHYLAELTPKRAIVSVGADNDYGHMHEQAKATYRAAGIPWYRTDQNGTVTVTVPANAGASYTVTPERPGESLDGPSDRRSTAGECRDMSGNGGPAPSRRRSRRRGS